MKGICILRALNRFPLSAKRTAGENGENRPSPPGQGEYAIPLLTLTGFGLAHIPGRTNSIIDSEINVVLGDSRILSPEIRKSIKQKPEVLGPNFSTSGRKAKIH